MGVVLGVCFAGVGVREAQGFIGVEFDVWVCRVGVEGAVEVFDEEA